jgi:uncharacterized protein (DUF433 family)
MEQQDLKILPNETGKPFAPKDGKTLSQEEWLLQRARFAAGLLRNCVEVDPNKRGGIPVLLGTRFTVAQLFAEMAEGRSIQDIADDFDLELEGIKALLQGFSAQLDRPMVP